MSAFASGSKFDCPHCGDRQDDVVDDCVIPGFVGAESRFVTDCIMCGGYFAVEKNDVGQFVVEKETEKV